MSSTNFGETSVFDVEKMAYDITGTPKNTKDVVYPTGTGTFPVTPKLIAEETAEVALGDGNTANAQVSAPVTVTVSTPPVADVSPAEAVGLDNIPKE